MKDADIDYSDIPSLDESFLTKAAAVGPRSKPAGSAEAPREPESV